MGTQFLTVRNRIFTHENGILRTEAADPTLLEDPSLIIYNVMRDVDGRIVVTNGSHTDTICDGLVQGESFYTSLHAEKHEPDAPNYTTRISGIIEQPDSSMTLSRISKSDFSAEHSAHFYYRYTDIPAGYGYCVTTYMEDGNPLPAFCGRSNFCCLWKAMPKKSLIIIGRNLIQTTEFLCSFVN